LNQCFLEAGVRGKVRIIDLKHFVTYVTLGAAYKSIGSRTNSQDIGVLYGGLSMSIQ